MLSAPLEGRRHVEVRERRSKEKEDWARMIRDLVDVHYPGKRIVSVCQLKIKIVKVIV